MNQLALNLVALSVFTMTMSSLLGPMFNLSPTIPAIATASLLGIATLDSFGWQGRGSTLVLDAIARWSPQHRARVLHHEAGHFLVAYLLQISVTGYALSAWEAFRQGQAGQGGVVFDTQELDTEIQQGALSGRLIDRYCTLWMAGVAAEYLVYGNYQGGGDDRQKFNVLWTQLKRPLPEGELKQRWAALQARNLIQQHRAAYEALVAALEQRASIEECYSAIASHIS